MKAFEDDYKKLEPVLNKSLAEIKRLVKAQVGKIHDPQLVRIRLTEARTKSLKSLLSKSEKKKWAKKDILKEAKDLLGLRIVCANTEDIKRIKELLLSNPRLIEIPQSEEDRTRNPTSSGYRDYKFYVSYETGIKDHPAITCEIQIRTVLQDSWATLAHKDIYKEGDDLPESLKKLSFRLSELLHVADQIAQDIRDEVSSKREPLKHKNKKITDDSLSLTYKQAFKELPTEYLTRSVRNKCEELGINNIRTIEKVLTSKKIGRSLSSVYKKATGWDIYDSLIFQVSPLIAACGIKIATDVVANVSLRIMNKVYLFHLYLQHVSKGRSSPLTGQIFVHFE
jgi:ppGpp synthetase/RelA/SpoT-type nucleotidyltranferase